MEEFWAVVFDYKLNYPDLIAGNQYQYRIPIGYLFLRIIFLCGLNMELLGHLFLFVYQVNVGHVPKRWLRFCMGIV